MFLVEIILAFGTGFVLSRIAGSGTFAETAQRIAGSERPYRAALSIVVLVTLSGAVLAFAFCTTLKPVNRLLAQLAMIFSLGDSFLRLVVRMCSLVRLHLYLSSQTVRAGTTSVEALAGLVHDIASTTENIGGISFGIGSVLFFYLFFKSSYIPRVLSALGVVAPVVRTCLYFAVWCPPNSTRYSNTSVLPHGSGRNHNRRLPCAVWCKGRGPWRSASPANAASRVQLINGSGGQMILTRNPGRFAGLLYVAASIPGFLALAYVPGKLFVHGNATTTANNIAAHELLFRLGIGADLIGQAIFIFVALALYDLLKGVNQQHALFMLTLILVAIPIAFLNEVNSIAAVVLVRGTNFLMVFDKPQRDALARLFLNLRGGGFEVAGIFWGLWLFPLGLLVYRSGFIPRFLGVLLMVGTFAYLANSFTSLVVPQYEAVVSRWMDPVQAVEVLFMLWLLIMGAKPKPLAAAAA